ncbi:sun domain-containing protein 1 [Lucilia sericata]|uniref:sun domain-containing protein 1 n=1 Tax=Lucilia sericata TaxID=13632 RepID=UPI0018A7FDE3|nr:sun domain-containing protein 1 [Lucilia sericata]
MSEYTIETRRRSRSKTPFLRSSCDHENCDHVGDEPHVHHQKKKITSLAPNVKTIVEETVEVTSSSTVGSGKDSPSKMAQTKIKTSDYSSEESPENKNKINTRTTTTTSSSSATAQGYTQQQKQTLSETRTSTTVITKSKKLGGSSSVATSTPKASNFVTSFASQYASRSEGGGSGGGGVKSDHSSQQRRYKEHTQNVLNAEKELSTSKNKSLSGFLGNSFGDGSLNLDASDHIAYLEYKKAGEYWKTTPKTDYTYSELSPHRRELAPGIVAMPNMSRQSLENHHERINYMIQRNPAQEEQIRRRYESSKYTQNRRAAERLAYDSGDEVDYSQYQTYRTSRNVYNYNNKYEESWLMRFITTIVTTLTTTWSTITGSNSANTGGGGVGMYTYSSLYQTKLAEERGFFGSIVHGISSAFLAIVRHLYLFISSVLCLDTWLLQSSNAESKSKKRFLLFLLMLLPLLLLAAWWLLDEQDRLLIAQRWHSLVPLSLITTLRSSLYTNIHTLKSFMPLFASSTHSATSQNMEDLKLSLSKSMAPEEYENILNHINSYIHQLVDVKLQEQQQKQLEKGWELNTKQTQLIVQIIKENLEALSRQKRFSDSSASLSDNDLNLIIQKVLLKLENTQSFNKPLKLSPDNIEEIKNLITQTIEVNNHAHYKLIVEKLDLDALIAKLLKAPLFSNYIQSEISSQLNDKLQEKLILLQQSQTSGDDHYKLSIEQQKLIIDNLNKDIAFIKLAFNDKLAENEDLHYSIKQLQQTQDALLLRLQELELSTDQKFNNLLQEITSKLNTLKDDQFSLLNQQVKLSLIEILGFKDTTKDGAQLSEIDLQNWVRNMFVAKDYLELRLAEINNRTNDKIKQEIDKSGMFLMRDISERLKQEIIISVENKQKETQAVLKGQIKEALSEQEVRNIVKSVLAIYDADKTGLVDFALESAGGQILSTRCTENYQTKTAQISVFGIPLWYPTNTPRIAISPNVQPGECWAFQGFPGFLVLKLNSLVYVTGFTLEHIPKSLAPNGRIDSAPRNFTVWGLEHEKDQEPILFGEYEYTDNDASLQYFPLQNKNIKRPYEIVELRIESNHGHSLYTCLYRFRVHGKPPAA